MKRPLKWINAPLRYEGGEKRKIKDDWWRRMAKRGDRERGCVRKG